MYDFDKTFEINSIQLEPRLQEYLKRKKFNNTYGIDPDVSEEKEFGITNDDLKIIKKYKKGHTGLYTRDRINKSDHFVEPSMDDFETPLVDFTKDPRYERIQKKMESHKKAQQQIREYSNMDKDYEIFHRSNPYDDSFNANKMNKMNIDKPYDDPLNSNLRNYNKNSSNCNNKKMLLDSRDLALGPSRVFSGRKKNNATTKYNNDSFANLDYLHNSFTNNYNGNSLQHSNNQGNRPMTYNNPPKINYNNYVSPMTVNGGLPHNHSTMDIIGKVNNSNKYLDRTYDYTNDYVDKDTKRYLSKMKTGTQRETCNNYQNVPFMYGNGMADVDLETSMRGGIRDSSKKSIGFKNTFEHNFSYISSDIQDPNHVVNSRPQSTRGANTETVKYKRKY